MANAFGKTDHTTFGGYIYPSDFNTDSRRKNNGNGSPVASRIMQDLTFDRQCRANRENRERQKREAGTGGGLL